MTRLTDRVLVIGGGPAGSAAALRLRQHRLEVRVVEKRVFPRPKTCGCCVSRGGLHVLDLLGLQQRIVAAGVPVGQWIGLFGGRPVRTALPGGVAISRERLDQELLTAAAERGAAVEHRCEARVRQQDAAGVTVELRDGRGRRTERFAHVVVAAGLSGGGLQHVLPWTDPPHGPFGISFTVPDRGAIPPGTIQMACGDGGYVGLVRREDGRIEVAAALRRDVHHAAGREPLARVAQLLVANSLGEVDLQDASPVITTPPLRRSRLAGRGRLLAAGDAAGYVEPFTGEGITWALHSGIAAADAIAAGVGDPSAVGDRWRRQCHRLLGRRKRHCRWLTTALRSSAVRRASAALLIRFPGLSQPIVRSLDGPRPSRLHATLPHRIG